MREVPVKARVVYPVSNSAVIITAIIPKLKAEHISADTWLRATTSLNDKFDNAGRSISFIRNERGECKKSQIGDITFLVPLPIGGGPKVNRQLAWQIAEEIKKLFAIPSVEVMRFIPPKVR